MSAPIVKQPSNVSEHIVQPLIGPYRTYAMSMLLALSIVNYLDRQVINILAEPIKHDLNLADWQLGLLTGLAFGVLYTFLGLPIARVAERGNRPLIIATSAAVWSVFTLACGFVQNFVQLAFARVGVGVGEAGCTPPAHSLIMDYAPREKRGSALAFYGLGPPFGGLLGMALGGVVADAYGWRMAFLMAGAPGLLLALLTAMTLVEPRKALAKITASVHTSQVSLREMFGLVSGKRAYWMLGAAITLNVFVAYGHGPFVVSFYLRNHPAALAAMASLVGGLFGFTLGSVGMLGILFGLIMGVGGALGTWIGGQLADRLGPSDPRRYVQLPALAIFLCVPTFVSAMLVSSLQVSLLLYALNAFMAATWYGPAFTAWFSLVPANLRATNSAVVLFVSNMVGLGLGPLTVGLMSDMFATSVGPAEGIRWALVATCVVSVATGICFLLSARSFRADMEP